MHQNDSYCVSIIIPSCIIILLSEITLSKLHDNLPKALSHSRFITEVFPKPLSTANYHLKRSSLWYYSSLHELEILIGPGFPFSILAITFLSLANHLRYLHKYLASTSGSCHSCYPSSGSALQNLFLNNDSTF